MLAHWTYVFLALIYRYQHSVRHHYGDVIMRRIASPITSLTIVYWTVYSGADKRKYHSLASLAFVRVIHRGPVNSPHKWSVTRKMFPFDVVIMQNDKHSHAAYWEQCVQYPHVSATQTGTVSSQPWEYRLHATKLCALHRHSFKKIVLASSTSRTRVLITWFWYLSAGQISQRRKEISNWGCWYFFLIFSSIPVYTSILFGITSNSPKKF